MMQRLSEFASYAAYGSAGVTVYENSPVVMKLNMYISRANNGIIKIMITLDTVHVKIGIDFL